MPILVAVVLLALLPATAAGADVRVLDLERPSPVSEYAGIAVVSAYDQSSAAYHLSVVQDGRLERLQVAPSPAPFYADIGPDSSGRPAVVFARCADPVQGRGCDVHLVRLRGPLAGREQPLSGVNTPASEFTPTLWRGRIAFARSSGRRAPVVYTRMLGQPPATPSSRQPAALPTGRCEVCTPPRRGRVVALELRGRLLAIRVRYGRSTSEIRLADVPRRSVRRVAIIASGEGGQSFVGVSFAGGWLGWYKACFGDPSGCLDSGGAFRFAPANGRYEWARDSRQFEGFALLDNGSLRVRGDMYRGCESEPAVRPTPGRCPLVRTGRLPFRPIAARRVRGATAL